MHMYVHTSAAVVPQGPPSGTLKAIQNLKTDIEKCYIDDVSQSYESLEPPEMSGKQPTVSIPVLGLGQQVPVLTPASPL